MISASAPHCGLIKDSLTLENPGADIPTSRDRGGSIDVYAFRNLTGDQDTSIWFLEMIAGNGVPVS